MLSYEQTPETGHFTANNVLCASRQHTRHISIHISIFYLWEEVFTNSRIIRQHDVRQKLFLKGCDSGFRRFQLGLYYEGQSSPALAYCLLVCLLSGILCTSALAAGRQIELVRFTGW